MLSCINTPFRGLPLHRLVMGSVCLWHTMGPCLPSMSACSPHTQLLPTPYPSWHGPSSASKQALGSPARGRTRQPLLNCCCLCSVLQCWLTSYQHSPKVATPRTGRLNAHRTLQSKHGYCPQEKQSLHAYSHRGKVLCIGSICPGCPGMLAAELHTGLDDVSKCRAL